MPRHGGGSRSGGSSGRSHGGRSHGGRSHGGRSHFGGHRSHHFGGHHYGGHHHHFGGHHHWGGHGWYGRPVRFGLASPRICSGICCCILIVVFFIIVLSVAPWNTSYENAELASLETKLVKVQTTWVDRIDISSTPNQFSAFRFDSRPPISDTHINRTDTEALSVRGDDYEYYAYSFIEGSSATVSFQTTGPQMDFYIIQGESDFRSWKNDAFSTKYAYKFSGNSLQGKVYNVRSTDDYYFVWENRYSSSSVSASVTFELDLATYDYSFPEEECSSRATCSFDLPHGGSQYIIILAFDLQSPDASIPVEWSLHPRTDYYWTIFGTVTAAWIGCVLVCFLSVLAVWYCKRQNQSSEALNFSTFNATSTPPATLAPESGVAYEYNASAPVYETTPSAPTPAYQYGNSPVGQNPPPQNPSYYT
eukprot:TRINITY_DN7786_c0_g1_i4.p1 TRINITY_DN7786_c0_g1~~TRINITY_DN7786_c0_g1_i4.p1  ORF type:complete len:420 (-),score=25.39 TRINITY_DN7786_c0_g1_i4:23-1282(-)